MYPDGARASIDLLLLSMASSEQQEYCDTELRLGRRPPPPPPERAREEMAPTAPGAAAGLTATELQAMAILGMATRAAAEDRPALWAAGDVADGRLSMRRSLKWFLQRRQEAARRRIGAAAPPPLHHPA